ncbi:MAG: RNA polymerase sigma factor [Candidatus Binatia bacterium]
MNPRSFEKVEHLLEQLVRRQAGQIAATLTRILGADRLDLVEDVVQLACLRALETWKASGVPANPVAWLVQVARNQAIDRLRHEALLRDRAEDVRAALSRPPEASSDIIPTGDGADDTLGMMFHCCHPEIPAEGRVALTLKAVAGFDVAAIARAFLAEEATIAQRVVRAKRRIRERGISFERLHPRESGRRLGSVLEVLYLVFNEGYAAHDGDLLVRRDVCEEAIRLASLLASSVASDIPRAHALLALMVLHASRFPARVDGSGELLLLSEQDRSRWDRRLIAEGLGHLERSSAGDEVSEYHLEAGIAACHAIAESYDRTDWKAILELYDQLLDRNPSPVVALNRAIAVSRCEGPEAGIRAVEAVRDHPALVRYHLYWSALATLHEENGDGQSAASCYRAALALRCSEPERRFLARRLARVVAAAPSATFGDP